MNSSPLIRQKTLNSGPSFKNLINIQKQKVKSCDKSRTISRTSSQSRLRNTPKRKQQEQTLKQNTCGQIFRDIENQNSINCNKFNKSISVSNSINRQREQNIVNQIIKTRNKLGKLQQKINQQERNTHKLTSKHKSIPKQNKKQGMKIEQIVQKVRNMQNFLSEYMTQINDQSNEIMGGYINKLDQLQKNYEYDEQQLFKQYDEYLMRPVKQFYDISSTHRLQQKIRKMQNLLL